MPGNRQNGENSMNLKYFVGATLQLIIKVVVFAVIIMYIIRAAGAAYEYGYRVFAEGPVSEGEGRTISIYIEPKDSVMDVGKTLEDKGLIRDARLFRIQELLSEQRGNIQPGVYDLSTSMTAQEMLAVIAVVPEEDEGEESKE